MHAAVAQVIGAIGWLVLGLVGLLLARLGRFYEQRTGRGTRYQFLVISAVGMAVGGVWDSWTGSGAGDWFPSVLLAASGIVHGLSAGYLFGMMLGGSN